MKELTATVRNAHGIHCRPSALIIKEASTYAGDITVSTDSGHCDLKSVYGLLSLGLLPESTVTIQVAGPDEDAYCQKLRGLFEQCYDFPPRDEDADA